MSTSSKPIVIGDSYSRTIRIKSSETNLPISLIGYTFYFTLKEHTDDTDVQALLINNITISNEVTIGEMEFFFTHDQTALLKPCNAYLEIKMKDTLGTVRTIEQSRKQIVKSYRKSLTIS